MLLSAAMLVQLVFGSGLGMTGLDMIGGVDSACGNAALQAETASSKRIEITSKVFFIDYPSKTFEFFTKHSLGKTRI